MKRFWQSLLVMLWVGMALPAQAALHEVVVLSQGQGPTREDARAQAVMLAKGMAIAKVARKLNPAKAQAYLNTLDAASMTPLIRGVTVLEEARVEKVQYAKVKVSVVDTLIREAYGEVVADEKAVTEKPRRAILVLPVFFDGETPVVWDPKGNPTYGLWRDASYAVGHGALLIPSGDPKERAIVDSDNALTASYAYLKPLLDGYGTDEIAIVVLSEPAGARAADGVEMVVRRVRDTGQRIERFTMEPKTKKEGGFEDRKALYARAVHKAAVQLTAATASTAHLEAKAKRDATQQNVLVQFSTLKDWASIDKRLRDVPDFVALDTISIGINNANLVLYVKKTPETARVALVKSGLIVADVSGVWRVRSR